MSTQNLQTIAASVILSIVASVFTNFAVNRQHNQSAPGIIRATRFELVDTKGQPRGVFELVDSGQQNNLPQIVLLDSSGRTSVRIGVSGDGDGSLEFASEHWNEGAVTIGHLGLTDPSSVLQNLAPIDRSGAWGMLVRSPQNRLTGVGFFNSGRAIVPVSGDPAR